MFTGIRSGITRTVTAGEEDHHGRNDVDVTHHAETDSDVARRLVGTPTARLVARQTERKNERIVLDVLKVNIIEFISPVESTTG